MDFHDTRFPTQISLGARGGPERVTEIVTLASGHEHRNTRWAQSRRRYNAGYGLRSLDDIHDIIAFFEERRGKLHGFRWKDGTDYKSCKPSEQPAPADQIIATGDGVIDSFKLIKTYSTGIEPYARTIFKPVEATLRIAIDAIEVFNGPDWSFNAQTAEITFTPLSIPANGATITAGFEFDVPVRFDTDYLNINLATFKAGTIPDIPIVELKL